MLVDPRLGDRPPVNVNHYQRFTQFVDLLNQLELHPGQCQRHAVDAFAAVHVAPGVPGDLRSSGLQVDAAFAKITRTGAADDHDYGVRLLRAGQGGFEAFPRVAFNPAARGVQHPLRRSRQLAADAAEHGGHLGPRLRRGVVAELVVAGIGVGADHGDFPGVRG